MAIKRPDIYEHNNPNNAFVDSNFVRGGTRTPVADLSELYSLSGKIDQLKERSTRVYVRSENAYYELVDISNVGKPSGWGKELQIESEVFLVVSELPEIGVENKIYIVPSKEPTSENEFDEWIWVNDDWERIGGLSIDLSNYYTKAQINNLLNNKVDKDGDKQLSDENFSTEEKEKLSNIEEGAQVNVVPDWNADTSNPRRIDNKPTKTSDFINDGATGVSPYAEIDDIPPPPDLSLIEAAISDLNQNKQDKLNFIPENSENKAETLIDPNNVTYPTTQAVADAIKKNDIIRTSNTLINAGWSGHDIITNGYTMTVNPTSMDYPDSFEVYLYNNSATDSAIVLNAKAGVTYTVIDNDVSSATVFLQAYGTAVFKRIGNTQNYILRGYII